MGEGGAAGFPGREDTGRGVRERRGEGVGRRLTHPCERAQWQVGERLFLRKNRVAAKKDFWGVKQLGLQISRAT